MTAAGLVLSSTSANRGATPLLDGAFARAALLQSKARLVDRSSTRLKKMRHGVLTAARLQGEGLVRRGRRWRAAMVTLTYKDASQWRPRHLSEYLDRARKYLAKHPTLRAYGLSLNYVWVAETQARGCVHYHVCIWLPKIARTNKRGHTKMVDVRLPKPDDSGWWPHGLSEIAWARKAVGYIAKYASKGAEPGAPAFPKGIRISGTGGLDKEGQREARWWRAPSEARAELGEAADIRRITGGRVDARTGLFWDSPWRFLLLAGKPHLILKGDIS